MTFHSLSGRYIVFSLDLVWQPYLWNVKKENKKINISVSFDMLVLFWKGMAKNISVRPCLTVLFWKGRNMEATAVRLYVNIKKEKTILVWKDKNGNGEVYFCF